MFQTKNQEKNPEKNRNETEINNLPDRKFKAIVIRMLTDLGKRIQEHSENFNKELENQNRNEISPHTCLNGYHQKDNK